MRLSCRICDWMSLIFPARRACSMYEPIMLLICCLMSRGCPWSVSAVIVSPGRSTNERLGTCGEKSLRKMVCVETPFCVPARVAVCASMAVRF
mgnify:CR=1 FL=1